MDLHDHRSRKATFTLIGIGFLSVALLAAGAVTTYSVLADDDAKPAATGPSAPVKAPARKAGREGLPYPDMTPEKGNKAPLSAPTGQRDGVSTGFPNTDDGGISAAVYFWEEYAFLDDRKARQQLEAVTSPDATGLVDEWISDLRKLREGVNLPPSGGVPAGLTFTTSVNAVRIRSLVGKGVARGEVLHIWLNYDRYATGPDGGPDNNPLKDETDDLIVKWQDGAWKLTNEPVYWKQRTFPAAYYPESPYAWADGWWQVRHAD